MQNRRSHLPGRPWVFDITLTGVLLVLGLVLLFTYRPDDGIDYSEPDWLGVLLVVAWTAPLMYRRAAPLPVALVLAVLNLPFLFRDYSVPTAAIVALIAIYSLGAYTSFVRGLAGLVAVYGTTVLYLVVAADRYPQAEGVGVVGGAFVTLGFFGAWAIGRSVRAPRMYAREQEERADQLERTREAEVRAALAEHRGQIARELHDVVAHHVSVMTVQAAGARRMLDRDPERSRDALAAIETAGRSALAEMRRIVGVLRGPTSGADAPARSPQPGLAELSDLAEQLDSAGLKVAVTIEGRQRALPLGIDLTAFRIVQEALTNTLKHAGTDNAAVVVRYTPAELEVRVIDSGQGTQTAQPAEPPGHGLLGMRERVALYGGELSAHNRPGGGFEVRARLPLSDGA
ncbi:MAG TPA: sensor histidine kinase [Jiangellaceae bacterium]|nr:sensor histidine kinase [Jiangellaceae bacterium]